MSNPSSFDKLLDLLIEALEERKAERDAEASEQASAKVATQAAKTSEGLPPTRLVKRLSTSKTNGKQATRKQSKLRLPSKSKSQDKASTPQPREGQNGGLERLTSVTDLPSRISEPVEGAVVSGRDAVRNTSGRDSAENTQPSPERTVGKETVGTIPSIIVSDNMPRTIGRLIAVMFLFVAFANFRILDIATINAWVGADSADGTRVRVPFASDGTLLSVQGSRRVYIIENDQRRWITTPEAFQQMGLSWNMIRQVPASYLEEFELGDPIELVAKCANSRHIFVYTLGEDGQRNRRYIADIGTFESLGYAWSDVIQSDQMCSRLNQARAGDPIPSDFDGRIPRPNQP